MFNGEKELRKILGRWEKYSTRCVSRLVSVAMLQPSTTVVQHVGDGRQGIGYAGVDDVGDINWSTWCG